jgi:beta-galactosidase
VWMTIVDPLHVAHWGTFVTTPSVDPAAATIRVETRLENEHGARRQAVLRTVVLDPSGDEVARNETSASLAGDGASTVEQELDVENPALWSTDSPDLYTLRQTVLAGGDPVDVVETPFGIRSAVFDPDRGFLLNGEPVKLLGVNLHHDGGPVGAAVPEAVWARRLRVLREMGANAIRTAHNPAAPEFMDLADRMGFLVMNEAFDEWTHGKVDHGYHVYFDEWSERDLVDFIHRDRNHPSVVLWSLGNEIGEQHAEAGDAVLRRLREITLREDPTRAITTGNDHIYADDGATTEAFLELLDVVGYNYVDRWHERREVYAHSDRRAHPERARIGTESGSVRGERGRYSLGNDPERPNPSYVGGMIRAENLWRFVALNDWFSGDFMWTGIDYLGETRWPRKGAAAGPIDLVGLPKDAFHFYRSQWTDDPVLHLFPHWNWPGREGQTIPVLAYTNMDTVELYLNDRYLGQKRLEFPQKGTAGCWACYENGRPVPVTTEDLHLSWDVPYEPGVLRAIGRRDGEVVTTEVRTAGPPARLRLTVDRDTVLAGERDVAHVVVEVVDAEGTLVPLADDRIRFSVEGPGRLLAVGNGDMQDLESYQTDNRRAYHGMAVAMVQSDEETGTIRVRASAEGLPAETIEVEVRPGQPLPRVPH